MPLLDTPAGHIFYAERRWPHSRCPPLVLLHGAGGSHLDWPPELRRVPGARTVCLDLPGHGRSSGAACSDISAYGRAIVALLDGLGIPSAILVGHSMGGAVAQQIALDQPGRVAGPVLIATGSKLPVDPTLPRRAVDQPGATVAWIVGQAWAREAPPHLKQLARDRLAQTVPLTLRADLLACNAFDARPALARISVPALVVSAGQDRMVPPKFSLTLAEMLPRAQLINVEGAGHMIILERPRELADLVRGWLVEQEWSL